MPLSLRGHFLLASPSLKDPNFASSVILMVRHDVEGAMGVIINKPLDVSVAEALGEAVSTASPPDVPLHRGGPCEGPMMLLHAQPAATIATSDEVLPGVQFTAAREEIEHVMADPDAEARYIIGYAGWQADQLEQEMAEGSWVVLPATSGEVFASPHDLWTKLMSRANLMKFIPPEQIPEDPGLN